MTIWHQITPVDTLFFRGSEPLEAGEENWLEIPSASFCTFEGERVTVEDFRPCRLAAAA